MNNILEVNQITVVVILKDIKNQTVEKVCTALVTGTPVISGVKRSGTGTVPRKVSALVIAVKDEAMVLSNREGDLLTVHD